VRRLFDAVRTGTKDDEALKAAALGLEKRRAVSAGPWYAATARSQTDMACSQVSRLMGL